MQTKSVTDTEIFARKEASRERDRAAVAAGAQTSAKVNSANAIATTVIRAYRPVKKPR